ITTTRENMSAQEVADYPLSGAIFTLQVAVAGMKKSRFIERQAEIGRAAFCFST
ncbi:hypothetical protein ONQ87_24285, partial [Salmonella enterica subsp. enterica serovar Virginia]|nr:hypothetical protein [Salmonella enterica subsp. enterica serovar Virginia]